MKTIERNIASAVIVSKDNKILMGWQDSTVKGVYPNCWHIPGGGVEKGETYVQAMQREVNEEVGIDVSGYKAELLDDTDKATAEKQLEGSDEIVKVNMNFHDYKVVLKDRNSDEIFISLKSDLVEYKWFDIKDLSNLKLTPPSQKLFKKLGWL
jgi:mutator protein MutT